MEVDPGSLPSRAGAATSEVVGEYAPNGALVVLVAGRSIPATYNPVTPWGGLARAARRAGRG